MMWISSLPSPSEIPSAAATAQKDGVRLIAVIMAAPDYKTRFSDARNLLSFGYATCRLYEDKEKLPLPQMPVAGGV